MYGDINQDGIIDILDVIVCINIIIESMEPTDYESSASDYNQDGQTNVQDVILLVDLILNS